MYYINTLITTINNNDVRYITHINVLTLKLKENTDDYNNNLNYLDNKLIKYNTNNSIQNLKIIFVLCILLLVLLSLYLSTSSKQ